MASRDRTHGIAVRGLAILAAALLGAAPSSALADEPSAPESRAAEISEQIDHGNLEEAQEATLALLRDHPPAAVIASPLDRLVAAWDARGVRLLAALAVAERDIETASAEARRARIEESQLRSRLSDLLNQKEANFLSVTDAAVYRQDDLAEPSYSTPYIAVNLSSIEMVRPLEG